MIRNSQEDVLTRQNKRLVRVWKLLLISLIFIVTILRVPELDDQFCNDLYLLNCNLYYALARVTLSLIMLLLGIVTLQHCCNKAWLVIWIFGSLSVVVIALCSFLYTSDSMIIMFQNIIPLLSVAWLIYQSYVVIHLAHYFHHSVVTWRFNSYLTMCPSFCTPGLVLQIYAGIAVIINLALLNCFNILLDLFQTQITLNGSNAINTSLLSVVKASFYTNITLSILSIQPQFNKGLITMNSLIAYQLVIFYQLIPFDTSSLSYFMRVLSYFTTFTTVIYMVMDRQHSTLIVQHLKQCRRNPLYCINELLDDDACSCFHQAYRQCCLFAGNVLRMGPTNTQNEAYELVSNQSVDSDAAAFGGWTTHMLNLYASPSTSIESAEDNEDIDPNCMDNEYTAETSLLRQHRTTASNSNNTSSVGVGGVNNPMVMKRSSSFNDTLTAKDSNNNLITTAYYNNNNNNSGGSNSGSNNNSGKNKLTLSITDANYNSINSPTGSSSSNGRKSFDIENNYQESTTPSVVGCSDCSAYCYICCIFPTSKTTTSSRTWNYLTSVSHLIIEKSTMFHVSLIGLMCYVCMLLTHWSTPDGTSLNFFQTSSDDGHALIDQRLVVFYATLCAVISVWVFYALSLFSSYKLYCQYQKIKNRLYESRLVQHHPTRTTVIL